MVSGHPLDSLKMYCERRSSNVRHFKMPMEELAELQKQDEEKFKKDMSKIQPKAIGVILDSRKIITKTGKNMMFLYCEGFDYDFEVTIYDKYFDDYKDRVDIGKIIVVEGRLMIDPNYNRKAIALQTANLGSLTQVRQQARDMDLLDNSRRRSLLAQKQQKTQEKINPDLTQGEKEKLKNTSRREKKFDSDLEEKIAKNKEVKEELLNTLEKYIITIPKTAKKDDLHRLKDFLVQEQPGGIPVFILLDEQEVDTKFSVANTTDLEEWQKQNLEL